MQQRKVTRLIVTDREYQRNAQSVDAVKADLATSSLFNAGASKRDHRGRMRASKAVKVSLASVNFGSDRFKEGSK